MTGQNIRIYGRRWPGLLSVSAFFLAAAALSLLSGLLTPTVDEVDVEPIRPTYRSIDPDVLVHAIG